MNITDDNKNLYSLLERINVDPSEFEEDLSNFTLDEPTKEFFEQLAGLLRCKLQMDERYEQVGTGELEDPEYESFGERPYQEGDDVLTVEKVWNDAKAKKAAFEYLLETVVTELGMDPNEEILVDGAPIAISSGNYQVLTRVPLKRAAICQQKTEEVYYGNAKFLCDVGRAAIVCDSEDQIVGVIEKLREKSNVVCMKNRFAHPMITGTRDFLLNIKVEGHVFEVQVHLADLLAVHKRSKKARDHYDYFRKYFVGNVESYMKRAELFRKLGDAILISDSSITEGIRAILEGEDVAKLEALKEITDRAIFASDALNLKAQKRLVSLLLKTGGAEEDLLHLLNNIALVYKNQGNYEKALDWFQRVLGGREASLGSHHPDTLDTINKVAIVYRKQGKYEKALEWFERVLAGREASLGSDQPATLDTVNDMAVVYKNQGNYEKALEWFERVLAGREASLGSHHPDTLDTVSNMGDVYKNQGKYEKALEWFERVLDGREASLGSDHPDTLDIVNNMGDVYQNLGKYEKALRWFERALDGREASLGSHHPYTLDTVNNMAIFYQNQGNYERALELHQRALDGYEANLGRDHPRFSKAASDMGSLYDKQGNYEKASELFRLSKSKRNGGEAYVRGQKVLNDGVRGDDKLGVKIMAEAITETLLFNDLKPPFALGVLGKWGRGKSFFFNLMMDCIVKLQKKKPTKKYRETFVGHIYVVKFDSWTFSKGKNIWSSLMYQILKELNEQLQFEKNLGKDVDISVLEVFRDFTTREREYLDENWETLDIKELLNVIKEGDSPSEVLKNAINTNYEDDKKSLEDKTNEIAEVQKLIELERINDEQRRILDRTISEMKEIVNFLGRKILQDALDEAFPEQKVSISSEEASSGNSIADSKGENGTGRADLKETSESLDTLKGEIKETSESLDKLKGEIEKVKEQAWRFGFKFSSIPVSAAIFFILLLILAIYLILERETVVGYLAAVLSPVIPYVTSFSSAKKEIAPIFNKFYKEFKDAKEVVRSNKDTEVGNSDGRHELHSKLEKLIRERTAIENRLFDLEGVSLRDTISKRIDRKKYEDNLGIVHKVQQDLEQISDAMLNKKADNPFWRGKPRIILFVDDLDRCPQHTVVEVIEAFQLLVKTNLFVAILAIDPRYVTLSLEKEYEGILDPHTPPSGMDFLEKIVQIPFRLPGMDQKCMSEFLKGQIQVKKQPAKKKKNSASKKPEKHKDATSSTPNEIPTSNPARHYAIRRKYDDLPESEVPLEEEESKMVEETLQLFRVSPRCIKRIINVFKILMVIWKRDEGNKFKADFHLKRAILFLMLMASDEQTREVTYKIFNWMEMGMVTYHNVACDEESDKKATLAELFQRELKKSDKIFEHSFRKDGTAKKGTLMFYINEYLGGYKWTSIEEWDAISFDFTLARCFSFYRLSSEEIDTKQNAA